MHFFLIWFPPPFVFIDSKKSNTGQVRFYSSHHDVEIFQYIQQRQPVALHSFLTFWQNKHEMMILRSTCHEKWSSCRNCSAFSPYKCVLKNAQPAAIIFLSITISLMRLATWIRHSISNLLYHCWRIHTLKKRGVVVREPRIVDCKNSIIKGANWEPQLLFQEKEP